MNDKQANAISKEMSNPQFAQLQSICSEITQAQQNALNHTHDALHMQMITLAQKTTKTTAKSATTNQGLGGAAPSSGVGSAPPAAPSAPNGGVGSAPPAPGGGVGSAPPAGGGDFNPANWNVNPQNSMHYVQQLYYLYDKLRTTDASNPNVLIYFLDAIAKLSSANMSSSAKSLFSNFTQNLMQQTSVGSPLTGNSGTEPFAEAIGSALIAIALYQAGSSENVTQALAQLTAGFAGSSNSFLNQVLGYTSGIDVTKTLAAIKAHSGTSSISKVFLSQIMQTLFGGTQNGGAAAQEVQDAQNAVRQAYMNQLLAEYDKMQAGGASDAELLAFVMFEYNLSSDDAGGYVTPINNLSELNADTSQLLGLFAPGGTISGSSFMSAVPAYYRMVDMWSDSPDINGGGTGSLSDIISGQLVAALKGLVFTPQLLKSTGAQPIGDGKYKFQDGIVVSENMTFYDEMNKLKPVLTGSNPAAANDAAYAMSSIIYAANHEMENTAGGNVPKRDSSLDTITSSLQAIESQISSANDTAKAQYQQANQTSANMLSTAGDMMKDLSKEDTTFVQNQTRGA